jgi:hypothetical protein
VKLPIKKKWFDRIKSGEKTDEIRDAHITFICEETGETLRKEITSAGFLPRCATYGAIEVQNGRPCPKQFEDMFEDDTQIIFTLGDKPTAKEKKNSTEALKKDMEGVGK